MKANNNKANNDLTLLLLAAGCSSRLGQAKQLIEIYSKTLLEQQVECALAVSCNVTVVLGFQAQNMAKVLANYPVTIVVNDLWQLGLASSIAKGVEDIQHAQGVMLLLSDQWQLSPDDLRLLIRKQRQAPDKIIASCWFDAEKSKQFGPPVIFPKRFFSNLIGLKGEQGAKPIISENLSETIFVDVASASIDLDTPEQLKVLQQYRKETHQVVEK